jgi:triacylglycerol lipase
MSLYWIPESVANILHSNGVPLAAEYSSSGILTISLDDPGKNNSAWFACAKPYRVISTSNRRRLMRMSYLIAAPEMMTAAATDLATLGSDLSAAHTAAASRTTAVLAAAEDEVSTAIATLFSAHGQGFQALGAQFNTAAEQFTAAFKSSASAYTGTEAQAANLLGSILAEPAIAPTLATGNPTFSGTPSLLTKIEGTLLFTPLQAFFNIPAVDQQLVTPGSPLMTVLADAPNIPGVNLLVSNKPPAFLPLLLGEHVTTTSYQGMPVVQIAPAHPDGNYVVAIHGGAAAIPPLIFHWIDYSMIAYQTGATVEVPIYPLIQQGGTAPVVIPKVAGLISSEVTAHGADHVSVLGDSAGANIGMAAVEYEIVNNMPIPGAMVLLSPPVDTSWSNPAVPSITGSWLPPAPTLQKMSALWAGGLPSTSYEVSPLFGPLDKLPPTTVYAGSQDVTYPDIQLLQQAAVTQGAPISFVYATGETHDWITVTPDGLHYWPQIREELGA